MKTRQLLTALALSLGLTLALLALWSSAPAVSWGAGQDMRSGQALPLLQDQVETENKTGSTSVSNLISNHGFPPNGWADTQGHLWSNVASQTITLTTDGFDPSVLTVSVGTEATWYNATSQTHVLQSGEPYVVYLPLILRGVGGTSGRALKPGERVPRMSLAASESFGGTLTPGGTFTHTFTTEGDFPYFAVTAPQFRGRVVVISGLPPDPADVAPELDTTVATNLYDATEFLYTGDNPIQTGVAPGTIDLVRVAIIRGRVLNREDNPLPGVTITILNHPEFGQTLSRADGMFDMAVNGGGVLTIKYEKEGYLPAQRQMDAPWQDYMWAPDAVLIPVDSQVTAVDLTEPAEIQVAQGSVVSDTDGARQATLLLPQGTGAELVLPGGMTQTINSLNVRLTEYTVGENGPEAMPAELPANVAYTYAAELSADEALAAGATEVQFDGPLYFYVEDFIGFPVGEPVPTGYYDKGAGQWVASENGRVIEILSITGGLADLDTDGDGLPDDPATLAALGITDAEREKLTTLYPQTPQTLWRVPVTHFTPWDCNWPYGCPDEDGDGAADCVPPDQPPPEPDWPEDEYCSEEGSVIECQNQILGQRVPLVGTPFSLNYRSDRVAGRKAAYTLDIPVSGSELPRFLNRIHLVIQVAGRSFDVLYDPPSPNITYRFEWDGLDAYGRRLQGMQRISVDIGYAYRAVYMGSTNFAGPPGMAPSSDRARQEIVFWQRWEGLIGGWNSQLQGLGGWSLDVHHAYDPRGRVLYLGDGSRRSGVYSPNVIDTVAGGGEAIVDGVPATETALGDTHGVTIAPDGGYYIASSHTIRKVDANGIITTVAGTGSAGYSGDGGPATEAQLNYPRGVAVAPDGSLYIADASNHRIRRVGPDGIISTVVGTGVRGFRGDGGLATEARLSLPLDVGVGPDGSLYIADYSNKRIRQVAPTGVITTVVGNGSTGCDGDGLPATEAPLTYPDGVDVGPDGSLYIGTWYCTRYVSPEGIIKTVAGNGTYGFSGDGGPATEAQLSSGGGKVGVAPDGSLYIADSGNRRIRRVSVPLPGLSVGDVIIPSQDSGELYHFYPQGRHARTLHALTGAVLYEFTYNEHGYLVAVEDGDGNVTTVERDAEGHPTAIVGPYGQRMALTLDPSGYLASITNPAVEAAQFSYTSDGLLTDMTDPRGNAYHYTYDDMGRLTRAEDPASGFKELSRAEIEDGYQVALTTAEGRTTTYAVERLSSGEKRLVNTFPNGLSNEVLIGTDNSRVITYTDGTGVAEVEGPDPRWGMLAPIVESISITTPGGLAFVSEVSCTLTLTDANDLLSLKALTDTVTLNGHTYTSVFDAVSNQLTATTPEGRQVVTTFDGQGRVTGYQVADLVPVSFTYNEQGRPIMITEGAGADARTYTITYGSQGTMDTLSDPLSQVTQFDYDDAWRVITVTLPDSREVGYAYDANSNLTSVVPPGQPAHGFAYTPVNLEETYDPPDVGLSTDETGYTYNLDRQRTLITRPDGKTIAFGYDGSGRLSAVTSPRGQVGYEYDPTTGRITTITAPDGVTLTYGYDGSLLTDTVWSGVISGSVGRVYDNDFRVIEETVNGGHAVSFQHDRDGLLTQADTLTLARDAGSGLIAGTTLGGMSTAQSYNDFAELEAYSASFGSTQLYSVHYLRDELSRITHMTETIASATDVYTYAYDLAGRLESVGKNGTPIASYTYDANGNRLTYTGQHGSFSGTYDAQDRLTQYGTTTYTYTANGELLTKTEGDQTTTYDYDVYGNLVSVELPDGTQIEYIIDGQNRRVGKKVNGTLVQGFLYTDWLNPVAELDGSGDVVSRFIYASRLSVPDYMEKGGNLYRVIADHLGSVRLVVDVNTGAIVQQMDYDEFGYVLSDTNPGFQPFGFAGGIYDEHSQLTRFGIRDYDASTGRWTSKDPSGFEKWDANLYDYCIGDPINCVDPSGLSSIIIRWPTFLPPFLGKEPVFFRPSWRFLRPSQRFTPRTRPYPRLEQLAPKRACEPLPDLTPKPKPIDLLLRLIESLLGGEPGDLPGFLPASLPADPEPESNPCVWPECRIM